MVCASQIPKSSRPGGSWAPRDCPNNPGSGDTSVIPSFPKSFPVPGHPPAFPKTFPALENPPSSPMAFPGIPQILPSARASQDPPNFPVPSPSPGNNPPKIPRYPKIPSWSSPGTANQLGKQSQNSKPSGILGNSSWDGKDEGADLGFPSKLGTNGKGKKNPKSRPGRCWYPRNPANSMDLQGALGGTVEIQPRPWSCHGFLGFLKGFLGFLKGLLKGILGF